MVAKLKCLAKAKVNLTLNVLYKRDDGYHELISLVTFADFGDTLELDCAKALGLSIEGDELNQIGDLKNNLVLRAATRFLERFPKAHLGHFHLIKRIPIAAGLGGGSADAAAALRLLAELNNIELDNPALHDIAIKLGADVPVCLTSQTRFMSGIGEKLGDVLDIPPFWSVLINPHIAVSTADVFGKLKLSLQHKTVTPINIKFKNNECLYSWLSTQKNDLQAPAINLQPKIADVMTALGRITKPNLIRMSGSGSTCFALYTSKQASLEAEMVMKQTYPDWWVKAVKLNGIKV
jgi:4-diphosphocytidyl-2-C-methyl-D-erythritol kinase